MKKSLARLKPELTKGGGVTIGRYVIGTVQGDIHDTDGG